MCHNVRLRGSDHARRAAPEQRTRPEWQCDAPVPVLVTRTWWSLRTGSGLRVQVHLANEDLDGERHTDVQIETKLLSASNKHLQ
eukprot:542742-Pyramimonas_sp.AAC.1